MAVNEKYRFRVHFLSSKEKLKDKHYQRVEELKRDAFDLYKKVEFNDHNAIIIYFNDQQQEVLLTTLPSTLPKGEYRDLIIKFVSHVVHHHYRRCLVFFPQTNLLASSIMCDVFEFIWNSS